MGKKAKGVDEPVDAPAQRTHTVIRYADGSYRWGSEDIEAETQAEGFEGIVAQGLTDEQAFTLVEELNDLRSMITPPQKYTVDESDWVVVVDEELGPHVFSAQEAAPGAIAGIFTDRATATLFAMNINSEAYEGARSAVEAMIEVLP